MGDNADKTREIEKELRESERKYRDLFENVSDFLYFHDLEGKFLQKLQRHPRAHYG